MKENNTIAEAKEFIKLQLRLNKDNIKQIKKMGYDTSELKTWNRIYKNILKMLDNMED